MKIICLHQSAELYGSDRSFLQVIKYLKSSGRYKQITILLPRNGPLVKELEKIGVEILFAELSLLSKTYLKTFQWGKILFPLLKYESKIRLLSSYDVVYVNTSVILDFYAFAPFLKNRKILHIREIPSRWLGKLLSYFIRLSKATVIFNSSSTKNSFGVFDDSHVIHNAFEGYTTSKASLINGKTVPEKLKILLIGRINSWKGQDFAIEALSKLPNRNFLFKIVGSAFTGNEHFVDELKQKVQGLSLANQVDFVDFIENPFEAYNWADVVIVPSKKPEPFGRIAIEAMSLGKPVIAANHGGLPEIVVHGESGFLFVPGNFDSFNKCIERYMANRELLHIHGEGALRLFQQRFSIQNMHKRLDVVFQES